MPWLYNWELWDPRAAGTYSGVEYVSMCRTQIDASQVSGYFSPCYAQHLLGFNEPDLLVINGVSSGQRTEWLRQFFGNCTSPACSFDFIPFSWYGSSLLDFQNYVTQFHSFFSSYPLWITEWQFTGQSNTTTVFLEKQASQWLDGQNYIMRYMMFGPMNAANMNGIFNGAMITDDLKGLTNVGKIYAGLI